MILTNPISHSDTLIYRNDPYSFHNTRIIEQNHEVIKQDRLDGLANEVSQLANNCKYPGDSSNGQDLYPLFRKLFDEAAEYLGDTHARLELIARTINMPLSISPDLIIPNKPLIDLARRASRSQIPSDKKSKCYEIFLLFTKYLNDRTKATWKNDPPTALKCLEPSWSSERNNNKSIGSFISSIQNDRDKKKFDEARRRYTEAVSNGFVDSKTFGTYLSTLFVKLNETTDFLLREKIREEATIVYTTASRLNFGDEFIDRWFAKIFKNKHKRAPLLKFLHKEQI
jgi:hypothetical protein